MFLLPFPQKGDKSSSIKGVFKYDNQVIDCSRYSEEDIAEYVQRMGDGLLYYFIIDDSLEDLTLW